MNRINKLFQGKNKHILSIYFTAGFPAKNDTLEIMKALEAGGADMIELGIPFSDPLADGLVVQRSSEIALQNGMNLDLLFEQTKDFRNSVSIPVVLMGYLNPVMQYGAEKFLLRAAENGFDGLIIPDLPQREYELHYKSLFEKYGLKNIFLITPRTSEERVRQIDAISDSFIYLVSSSSTTGAKDKFSNEQEAYFKRIASYKLRNPLLAGFGISNHQTFAQACEHTNGAIIGSAFIRALEGEGTIQEKVSRFINGIKQFQKQHA